MMLTPNRDEGEFQSGVKSPDKLVSEYSHRLQIYVLGESSALFRVSSSTYTAKESSESV